MGFHSCQSTFPLRSRGSISRCARTDPRQRIHHGSFNVVFGEAAEPYSSWLRPIMNFQDFLAAAEQNLFIIAEAGVNHNGKVETGLQLVDAAVNAGCNAVKFQTWITEKVYSRDKSIKPDYQSRTTDAAESEIDTIQ